MTAGAGRTPGVLPNETPWSMRRDGARAGCLLRRIKIESFEGRKHDLTEGFSAEHAEQVAACMHLHD